MEFILFEAIAFITWLLLIFGFYDRVFFLMSMTLGFFFSAWAINDPDGFVINQVFDSVNQVWVKYTISVYPYILLMDVPVIASFIIFIVLVLPNQDNDILF